MGSAKDSKASFLFFFWCFAFPNLERCTDVGDGWCITASVLFSFLASPTRKKSVARKAQDTFLMSYASFWAILLSCLPLALARNVE